ncbi:DEKNAAC100281 [Brettanomyces naardenensis]|uniref:DEKNAAC100281 n=1 Tax=Brettanomyces naardenensis TaxID=13370 RepID=A0A448YGC5_BRENA|nr:DEKNAAC100281 [Brettanomyces naardenensis]
MTPCALNRTGFPQNSKKRALYSPSSSASSTPRCRHHSPHRTLNWEEAQIDTAPEEMLEDAASSSPFTASNQTTPSGHRRSRRRAALKRSFGFLNLSLETSPTTARTMKKQSSRRRKDSSEMLRSFDELQFEDTPCETTKVGSFIKPPKKKPSKVISSPFLNPNKVKAIKKLSTTSRWKKIFVSDGDEKLSQSHLFNSKPNAPFLSPQSLPNSSFRNDSPVRPKVINATNILDRQTGPLDRTPFSNPADAFITPASFNSVKPLQIAFTSTGLRSKKTLASARTKAMPETPCKRPPHSMVDVNGSFAGMNASFNSTMTGINVSLNSNATGAGTTPRSNSQPSRVSRSAGSSSSGSSKKTSRSERAINTADLQSCILKFTNEFDDLYDDGNSTGISIFTDNEQQESVERSGGQEQQQPQQLDSSPCQNEDVPMEEEIDLDKIDEIKFDGFPSNFNSYDNLPPTPTRLGSTLPNSGQSDKFEAPQFPNSSLTPTKKHLSYWRRASSSTDTAALGRTEDSSSLQRKTVSRIISTLSLPPATPVLSGTAPHTPVESVMGLSQQSAAFNPKALAVTMSENSAKEKSTDPCLMSKFGNCKLIGSGEFSIVYETQYENFKYAVKRTKRQIGGPKTRMRKLEEVEILKTLRKSSEDGEEGKEYVLNLVDYWEFNSNLYIMTEFCENGSLERFLAESGKVSRLDEWRVWKIMVEILLGVQYIHKCGILHLDLKPANILITFEGSLKIGDFGVASKLPIPPFFDREGDREYIAPEVISKHIYGKPADIFSCGLIMVEIAANIVLPDNGTSWQKLRSGDLTDAGKLSSSDLTDLDGSLFSSTTNTYSSNLTSDPGQSQGTSSSSEGRPNNSTLSASGNRAPSWAPRWFLDGSAPLDKVVAWMIDPNPDNRPSASQVLKSYECSVVDLRRKSGATIYEGDYGPRLMGSNPEAREILNLEQCLENTRYKLSRMTTTGSVGR